MKLNDKYKIVSEELLSNGLDLNAIEEKIKNMVIQLPSWAVGNSGTRYGTFRDKGAAANVWQKIDDCAEIQRVLGVCPVMASHVLWDVTEDGKYLPVREYAESKGMNIGTVHPNTFAGQEFRYGSLCSPIEDVTLDSGHFHPTETISDKISSVLLFVDEILLHVSRGVRWDSDHIVNLTDDTKAIARECVQNGTDKIHMGLDFFDGSVKSVDKVALQTKVQ